MLKKNIICFLALLLVAKSFAGSVATFPSQIKKTIDDENIVGISWSTVSSNSIEVGSAGYANITNLEVMKPVHKMHVGSVTKSVLAIGILHLIVEERLSLDSNIESILSGVNFDNPWHHRSPIKIKNLLDHTAGLDNIRMWQLLSTKPSPNMPLKEAFPSSNRDLLKVRTEPGTQYSYSNMGYTLLAMVIEAVTNQRYEEYLDENLLSPLGMHDSSFEFISQQGKYADPLLAMGYHENNVAQLAVPNYLRPAGQFTTTAPDMAKFIKFLLNDGKLNGKSYVNPEHMQMLTKPLNTKAQNAGLNIGHGLAFANRDRHNVLGMCHPGTTFGFRAYICLFPEEKKGFFYAINTDNETSDYEKFNKLFINQLNIASPTVSEPSGKSVQLSKFQGIYIPSPNNMAEFEFMDMLFNFIYLEESNQNLLIKSLQNVDRRLQYIGEGLFRDVNRTQVSHVIYSNDKNQFFISDGLRTFKKTPGITLVMYWLSLLLGLIGFLYILIVGSLRLIKRDKANFKGMKCIFLNLVLFGLPIYFYANQSFLQFGDITPASVSLAVLSGFLPLTLLVSLWFALRGNLHSKLMKIDISAMIMALQFCLVLTVWGYIPITFWP